MKKLFLSILLLALSFCFGYFSCFYLKGVHSTAGIFISGVTFGIFLMTIKLNSKNDKINSYKRELERESVSSGESEAKVKVLEAKVQVLEKALENALKK